MADTNGDWFERSERLPEPTSEVPAALKSALDAIVAKSVGGLGPLKAAIDVAEEHRRAAGHVDLAIDRLIATHVRLATASGFVTGLGGIATLPVTLPAGVAGQHLIAARMSAGFRLVTKFGSKGVVNLAKGIPIAGGVVGGTVDRVATRVVAHYALSVFAIDSLTDSRPELPAGT